MPYKSHQSYSEVETVEMSSYVTWVGDDGTMQTEWLLPHAIPDVDPATVPYEPEVGIIITII